MKPFLLCMLWTAWAFAGQDSSAVTLLDARPVVPCIEVRQWQGRGGFIERLGDH